MKLGITGTQIGMTEKQFQSLTELLRGLPLTHIHGGDCIGFDAECVTLAKELHPSIITVGHPPTNPKKRAFLTYDEIRKEKDYHSRNHDIVDETDLLIACPKSPEYDADGKWIGLRSGTWTTVRYAKRKSKTIIIVMPDGTCLS